MNLNKVFLMGYVGNVYPVQTIGYDLCNITIATSNSWKDKKTGDLKTDTEWHKIVCHSHAAVKAKELNKGDCVYVEGAIKTNKYIDKNSNQEKESKEIKCYMLNIVSRKKDRVQNDNDYQDNRGNKKEDDFDNDEIPF